MPRGNERGFARRLVAEVRGIEPARPRRTGRIVAVVLTVLVLAALGVGSSFDVPYYAISPGSARGVNDLVRVPADRRHTPKGKVLFVTVGVRRLKALEYVKAANDGDVEVVEEERILGTTKKQDYNKVTAQEMSDSKETAEVIALQRLGFAVTPKGKGAFLEDVVAGSPADKSGLRQGDTVVGAEGATVSLADDLLRALRARRPGDVLRLQVLAPTAGATARPVDLRLGEDPKTPGRPFAGVSVRTQALDFDLPFAVDIDSGRVGGPSAGLAFTLALIDELTPGELTGGKRVAVTGTIELDGSVGAVGGVPQKAIAVRRAKVDLFLVPSRELEEARAKAGPSVQVVPVDTLDQALLALRRAGGSLEGIPSPPGE